MRRMGPLVVGLLVVGMPVGVSAEADPMSSVTCSLEQEALKESREEQSEAESQWSEVVGDKSSRKESVEECLSGIQDLGVGGSLGLPSDVLNRLMERACDTAVDEVNDTVSTVSSDMLEGLEVDQGWVSGEVTLDKGGEFGDVDISDTGKDAVDEILEDTPVD